MRPYFDDGHGIVIYLGDCREILPQIGGGTVDLVLTDPPYGVRYVTAWRSRSDPLVAPIAGDESLAVLGEIVPLLDLALAHDRHVYVFASPMRIGEASAICASSWNVKNIIVWDKGDAGTVGDLRAGYGVNWEAVVYASKGQRSLNGPRPRALYRYDWSGRRDPVHPTAKPTAVFKWLMLKSSASQELVIDPFMGCGPCLRAAKELGRRCIGIEIEERYAEIAARRLEQEVMPLELSTEGVA